MRPGAMVVPAASMRVAPDGIVHAARRADRGDAIAGDDDVGAREDLVALHRDDAGACQCEDAARRRARGTEIAIVERL